MHDNLEFYNHIVSITKLAIPKKCSEVLNRDAETVLDLILKNYKENIEIAATYGKNSAYLCIYKAEARYQKNIPIDYFVHMPEKIKCKFEEYALEPVESRLRHKLQPFNVRICRLSDCSEFQTLWAKPEHESLKELASEIIVISVSWE